MKILIFAPHAGIWIHSFPEALVSEALRQHNHELIYVTCGGIFNNYCITMSAVGLSPESDPVTKNRVCADCKSAKTTIRNQFGFASYDLETQLDSGDMLRVQEIVDTATAANFQQVVLDGIELGRFALYEFLLRKKKGDLTFSSAEWKEYQVALRNTLYAFFSVRKILRQEHPDRIVVYNSLYSVNRVSCRLAELQGIPSYFLHAGGNLAKRTETLLIGRQDGFRFYSDLLAYWPKVKDLPCTEKLLEPVTEHYLELLRGRSAFVYSTRRMGNANGLRNKFHVPPQSRVLVVTMSSLDERFAAETVGVMKPTRKPIFPNQIEWIRSLVEFVRSRTELHLIIRVHPREFPNKREGLKSAHAAILEHELSALPANAIVNWPQDRVSLYDLAEIADVFLNAWSAAGKEMALLGIPVVTYSADLLAYPGDLNYGADSVDGYFAKIEQAMREGWSIERSRQVFRWGVLEFERAAFDLHESFPSATTGRVTRRFLDKVLWRMSPTLARNADCFRRASKGKDAAMINEVIGGGRSTLLEVSDFSTSAGSLEHETAALRKQIRKLVYAMYGSSKASMCRSDLQARLTRFSEGAS